MQIDTSDLAEAIAELCGKIDPIRVREWFNGGVRSGSLHRRIVQRKPKFADECAVLRVVVDAYHRRGENIELYTEAGQRRFAKVLTDAIKRLVAAGNKVSFADRLAFEQAVYSGKDGRDGKPYMKMYGCSRDFNSLESVEVETERSENYHAPVKIEAPNRVEPVGRKTTVRCPHCGQEIVIANTEDGYLPLLDENGEPYRLMD